MKKCQPSLLAGCVRVGAVTTQVERRDYHQESLRGFFKADLFDPFGAFRVLTAMKSFSPSSAF